MDLLTAAAFPQLGFCQVASGAREINWLSCSSSHDGKNLPSHSDQKQKHDHHSKEK
jgi:hypothetical protein